MSDPNPEQQAKAIQEAILAGNKILAIKLYREQTGLGLAEAKGAVEALEAKLRGYEPGQFPQMAPKEVPAKDVKDAILAGHKIEAIKLYREKTGVGLKEAKEAVEKLEAELRESDSVKFSRPAKTGCTSLIVLSAIAVVIWRAAVLLTA